MLPDPSDRSVPAAQLSQSLGWACLVSAFALPVLAAAAVWGLGPAGWLQRLGINTPTTVSAWQMVVLGCLSMLPVLVLSHGLIRARHCLAGLARGDIFALTTVTHLRAFARSAAMAALLGMLVPAVSSVLLTWQAAAGQRALSLNIAASDLMLMLFAGVIWQVATVLAKATELAEEHAQIV